MKHLAVEPADRKHEASVSLKDLAVLIPICATALAVAFDVGYFTALDINFFTLFTLSEHVLFTLEALPLVFVVMVVALMFFFAGSIAFYAIKGISAFLSLRSRTQEAVRIVAASIVGVTIHYVTMKLVGYTGLDMTQRNLLSISSTLFAIAIIASIAGVLTTPLLKSAATVFIATALLFATFVAGTRSAQDSSVVGDTLNTLSFGEREISGRLLRSGEKGVLFMDASVKRAAFYKWEDIKALSTTPGFDWNKSQQKALAK